MNRVSTASYATAAAHVPPRNVGRHERSSPRRSMWLALAAAIAAGLGTAAIATYAGEGMGAERMENPKFKELGPLARRMDSRLIPHIKSLREKKATPKGAAAAIRKDHGALLAHTLDPDSFLVHLDCKATDALVKQIAATGAVVTHTSVRWNTVMVLANVTQLDELAKLEGIKFIAPEMQPIKEQQGVADNHADIDMKADQVRSIYGVNGTGQKVGVLSDTVNRTVAVGGGTKTGTEPNAFLTGTIPQLAADLPNTASSLQIVDLGPASGTDEGEAMLELIHDIAPGASLAFGSAYGSQTAFADNISLLHTAAGCTVTVDDVKYLSEPFFQDGPIAQAIQTNFLNGVVHFSSAGNYSNQGVLADCLDIDSGSSSIANPPTGEDFHDWGIGGANPSFLPIDMNAGVTLTVILQWNQPFSTYGLGAGSQADLDLYLYDAANTASILASSAGPQGTSGDPQGDPVEALSYKNTTASTRRVYLAVDHFAGLTGNRLRAVFMPSGGLAFPSGGVGAMTTFGHATATNCVAVGAIFYGDIKDGGTYPPDVVNINAETFSSKGGLGQNGVEFYFDTSGNPIPVQRRDKPDLAAPDGTNVSVFSVASDSSYDADTLPNFFGTSAAAPNAAAAAALLLQRMPSLTPSELISFMKASARDIVATNPLSTVGPDDRTGAGLVDALGACVSIWDGGATDDNWTTAANWVGDVAPVPGSSLVFAGTTRLAPNNDFVAATFSTITFRDGGFTLGGNAVTLTGGTAITNSTGTNSVTLGISQGAATTIRAEAGTTLTLSNGIINGGFALAFAGAGDISESGMISGSGGLTKTGTGVLTLSGANTYTGVTTVNAGTIRLGSNSGLGATTGNTVVASGAVLDLDGRTVGVEPVTLNGTGIAGSGALINGGATAASLSGAVTVATAAQVTATAGPVTLSGAITNTGGLTVDGAFDTTLGAGVMSGAGGVTKIGTGMLVLSGANTYTGVTTVNAGTVRLGGNGGLGGTGGNTVVASGAVLDLSGWTVGAEPLTLNGTGIAGSGALLNSSATAASLSGAVTVATAAQVTATTGNVALSGAITNTGGLTVDGAFGTTLGAGAMSGAGGLTKNGTGTLTLSGGGVNTYTGTTIVNEGRLDLNKTAGTTAVPGALIIGDGVGLDEVRLINSNQIAAVPVIINESGYLNLATGGRSDAIGSLTMTGGSVATGAGTLTLGGDLASNAAGTTAVISGNLALGASRLVNVADGTAVADMDISAAISGAGFALTKTGSGTLRFSGTTANTYNNTTTVNAGVLELSKTAAVNAVAGALTIGDGVGGVNADVVRLLNAEQIATVAAVINSSGLLDLNNWTETIGDLSGTGNIVFGNGTNNTFTITDTGNVIFSGVISGTDTGDQLAKSGAGTLTLSGANSHAASTAINAGILNIQHSSGLGTSDGGTTVANTATLQLQGGIAVGSEALILNGTGTGAGALENLSGNNSFAGAITLATASTIGSSTAGDTLTLSGGIINGATAVTFAGLGDTLESGVIDGARNLTRTGSGTLFLGGANSYSGTTTVSAGILNVQNSSALGTTGSGTTVANTATLRLQGGIAVGSEALALTGVGAGGGALESLSGNNSFAGLITLSAASTIGSSAVGDTLTLTGGMVNGGSDLTFIGAGDTTESGLIGGARALTKNGAGSLTLSGTNTYTGVTTISGGTIKLGNISGLGATTANTVVASGAVLDLSGIAVGAEPLTLNGTGIAGSGSLINTSATAASLSGAVTIPTASQITAAAGNLTLSGAITNTGGLTVAGAFATTLGAGAISGAGGLTKNDAGTLTLTGANTYNGTTTVSGGTLLVNNASGSGTGAGAVGVAGGATLGGTGAISGAVTVNGTLAPGVGGTGALGAGSGVAFGTNSMFLVDVAATVADSLAITGNLTLTNNEALQIAGGSVFNPAQSPCTICTTTGTISGAFDTVAGLPTYWYVKNNPTTIQLVYDNVPPAVNGVSSTTPDGTYRSGQAIAVTVTFSEAVTVNTAGGTPTLTLETGTSDAMVNYTGGSGTATLTFNYTVAAGQNSADLDYVATTALALNSGTIRDVAGNNATLTLPAPGAIGSLGTDKNIVVDTASATTVVSSLNPSTYGQSVTFTATVTGGGATPTGSVTFKDGATTLGTGSLSSGQATCSTSALAVGSHSITVVYGGDANYGGSTSPVLTQTVNPGPLDHFAISAIASPKTAGTAFTIATITAQDLNNNTVTGYTGTVDFSTNAGTISPAQSGAFTAGLLSNVSVTVTQAGTLKTINATDHLGTKTGTSITFTVNPGVLDHFAISAIASPKTAGTAFTIATITAQDLNNNTVTGYMGTVDFSTNAGTISPAQSGVFTAGVFSNASVTVTQAGTLKTIGATDHLGTKTGTSNTFTVNPGVASQLLITSVNGGANPTAGTGFSVVVQSRDAYDNPSNVVAASGISITLNTGTGTVGGTTTGTIAAGANTATVSGVTYTKAESGVKLNAVRTSGDALATGLSAAFTVNPGVLDHFAISAIASPKTAGTAFTIATITAQDLNNNTVTGYTGTVDFSTNAGTISPTQSGAFTAGVLSNASVTVTQAGANKTLSVTDHLGTKTGTSSTFTVNPGGFVKLQILLPGETSAPGTATGKIGAPSAQTAGTVFSVAVNAVDANWNVINTVSDAVGITASDSNAALPANATLVAGTKTFSVTLKTAGTATVTATDISNGSKTANTSPSIMVNPGVFAKLQLLVPGETAAPGTPTGKTGAPAPQVYGTAFTILANAVDANWNLKGSEVDTIQITSTDGAACLPANATLVGGTTTFSVTLKTVASTNTITASDVTNGAITPDTSPALAVSRATLTVTGAFVAGNKTYDGSTAATIKAGDTLGLSGVIAPDVVSLTKVATFANKNVGTGKTVSLTSSALSGADAGNYALSFVGAPTAMADITALAIAVTAVADTKTYDGTANSTGVPTVAPPLVGGDTTGVTQTFSTRNVGTGKTLTAAGAVNDGNGGANYIVAFDANNGGVITALALTVSGTFAADSGTYDGTAAATITAGNTLGLSGVIVPDVVSLTKVATFADKNVGANKTVSLTSSTLGGADAGNYTLSFVGAPTATADIAARPLTVTATGVNKAYDGTTVATVTLSDDRLAGDTLATTCGSAAFADPNPGTGKTVTVSAITISGTDADNYTQNTTASTTADITQTATKLVITVEPTTATAGNALSPSVKVEIRDANGFLVTSASNSVTLSLATNASGATVSGTVTVQAVGGVATFDNVFINTVGSGLTLAASADGLTGATGSSSIGVSPGAAAKLVFVIQPSNTNAGLAISPAVQVAVQDAFDNTVTSATNAITVAIGTNAGGGTLSGTVTVAAINGTASFNTLSINKVGNDYTLTAAATGLSGATSTALNIVDTSPPTVTSGLTPGTTQGVVGEPVTFTYGVSDAQPVTYTWAWGDGTTTTTTEGSATHTFTAPGTHTVKVTATDSAGLSTTSSVSYTVVAGATPPTDDDICAGLTTVPLRVQQVAARLRFPSTLNKDSLTLKGVVQLNDGFNPDGQLVRWDIGGVRGETTLNAKGNSPLSKSLKVSLRCRKPAKGQPFTARLGKLAISIKNVSLEKLVLAGIAALNSTSTSTKGDPATVQACVVLKGHQAYHTAGYAGVYKAKKDKGGAFKAQFKL